MLAAAARISSRLAAYAGVVPEQPRKRPNLAPNERIFHFYFARDDSHHVGNDSRLELARAFDCRYEFAIDKVGGRFKQFN